jgi:hypothetical protein
MNRVTRVFFQVILFVTASTTAVRAQQRGALESGAMEWGLWAGYSFSNPTLIGSTTNRQCANAGLRFGYVFATKGNVTFEYTLDVVPAAILVQPPGNQFAMETGNVSLVGKGRSAVYGFGVLPAGFKLAFARRRSLQPFFAVTTGMVYSMQKIPFPITDATRTNFTFEVGGGVQWMKSARKAFILGYKFAHISNAYRTSVNPGVDANMVYMGFSIFK